MPTIEKLKIPPKSDGSWGYVQFSNQDKELFVGRAVMNDVMGIPEGSEVEYTVGRKDDKEFLEKITLVKAGDGKPTGEASVERANNEEASKVATMLTAYKKDAFNALIGTKAKPMEQKDLDFFRDYANVAVDLWYRQSVKQAADPENAFATE